ncbi:MAG TPA: DUF3943 domain-containing protein [Pseudomonadales bacterium]
MFHARGRRRLAIAFALLTCAWVGAAGADPAARHPSPASQRAIAALLDCRLWLSALDDCPTLPAAGHNGRLLPFGDPAPAPPAGPDRAGIRRDTLYFLGLQLSVIGALYFMPESVSGWSNEQKEQHRADKWWNNVTNPTWDDDDDYINYVLHPYWGAAYYVRARERGFGARQAFWYSFLLSTLYEAGVEALFEPISIQDFFVTPIVGSWLGGHFMHWRTMTEDRIARTGTRRFRDTALLVATDPLGHAADFVDRRLGRQAELTARPFLITDSAFVADPFMPRSRARLEETYGIRLMLRW